MHGRPVWLASVSLRTPNGIVPNTLWTESQKAHARKLLAAALKGVGDPEVWRLFRMQITYCLHKAVSDHELELVTVQWRDMPGTALAGGPVEILDSAGCSPSPSVLPCENPTCIPLHKLVGGPPQHPDAWFPEDCGQCAPCLARAEIEAGLSG